MAALMEADAMPAKKKAADLEKFDVEIAEVIFHGDRDEVAKAIEAGMSPDPTRPTRFTGKKACPGS